MSLPLLPTFHLRLSSRKKFRWR